MRGAILLLVIAVVVVTGAWWLSNLPGDLAVTVAGTTIQTSTSVAIVLSAAFFLVLYVVIRLIAWVVSLPGRNRRWRLRRRREQGDAAVTRALVALAANDAGAARREAERTRRLLGDGPLTLLLSAQAALQAGRTGEAENAFRLLADQRDGRLLGLRGLMRQAMAKQDWATATQIADQAEAAHPGAAWLRDERRYIALRTGQWRDALRLARPENRAALAVAAADEEPDQAASLRLARQAFEASPGLPVAALAYAKRLRLGGRERQAQDVLRRAWSLAPQPDLAEAYVLAATDNLARAREMAVLVRSNPDHVESAVAIGHAALEAGLTGEAHKHVRAAIDRGANERRLWTLLADIAVMDGRADDSQDALRHVAAADPDPVWRCSNCGTAHMAWHPVCHACEATGAIAWMQGGPTDPNPAAVRIAQPAAIEGLTS